MNRITLVVAALASITALLPLGGAGAGFTDTTTIIVLACDRGAGAQVSVTLQDSLSGSRSTGAIAVACDTTSESGVKRVSRRVITSFTVGAVTVDSFTVQAAGVADACAGSGPLTYRQSCPGQRGTGAALTVR